MSQSPPTAEEGTTQEAGPEAGSSRGQRALQEARLCRGVPAPQPRPPRASGVCPWLTLYQASWNPSWHMGVGGWHPESRSQAASPSVVGSMQRWQSPGQQESSGRADSPGAQGWQGASSGQAQPLTCGRRAPAAGVAEPKHQVPGGTGAAHMAAARGWASRMWVLVDTLLLPRGVPGPSPRPLPNLLRHRPAGPGAGSRVPTASSPAASGCSLPRRREATENRVLHRWGGGDTVHGIRDSQAVLTSKASATHPGGWAMIARRSPEGFQVARHRALRAGTRIPGREGTAHGLLPGPAPAAEATPQVSARWGPPGRGLWPPTAPGDGQGPGQELTAGRESSMEGREAAPGTPERRALSDPGREARLQEGPAPSMGVGVPDSLEKG